MPTLAAPYPWTFIDGPPLVFDVAKSAIMASDLVVIPVQPSAFDIWSAKKITDLIAGAQMYKPCLKYKAVPLRPDCVCEYPTVAAFSKKKLRLRFGSAFP